MVLVRVGAPGVPRLHPPHQPLNTKSDPLTLW